MHIRRTGKFVTGVITAVAALAIMSLPAAANTANVDITSGSLALKNQLGTTIDTIDLGNPGPSCTSPASTVTTTTGTSVTGTLRSHSAVEINGQDFIVQLTITLTGTYGGSAPTYSVSGTISASATIIRSTGSGSCTALSGAGNCTVTASGIAFSGTVSAADIHNLVTTDSANVSGSSGPFTVSVTGSAANCGTLTAINNGSVALTSVVIHVL
jgi:hypothetical protein